MQGKEQKGRLTLIDEKNVDECAALLFGVFSNEPFNLTWLKETNIRRYCRDMLKTPHFIGFFYTIDGAGVGACLGVVNDYFSQAVYDIKEIFIVSSMQRKGLGGTMLREIEKVLAAKEICAVTLFTRKDIPAYSFYLKNSYSESPETVYFYKALQ
ncbi:MAG: GNAT family N-acetyltransferase [Clostridiales bacterium]|jgi:predicted acetyltransferase|nr:GNAT family N-acetyltransferase [Clostridiales bacterium]